MLRPVYLDAKRLKHTITGYRSVFLYCTAGISLYTVTTSLMNLPAPHYGGNNLRRFNEAVTRWSRSTQLRYTEPG